MADSQSTSGVTRVLTVDAVAPERDAISDAARVLQRGGLVAFPTETVYGLGANALDERAIERLFIAKGRPATDPVIVHITSAENLSQVARAVPDIALQLAERFWPGPLTMIFDKQPVVPDAITAGLRTVGVRVPSHPVAMALLQAASMPIAAPSANRFSRPSPTLAQHVMQDLDGRIDLVLDAGPTAIGVESTVLDLTVSPPLIRRPGGASVEALRELIPELRSTRQSGDEAVAQRAPGQLSRHYAPRATLTFVIGDHARVIERIGREARSRIAAGTRIGILAPQEDLIALAPSVAAVGASGRLLTAPYGSRRDPARAAQELFAALRRLDADGVDEILASAPDPVDIGLAIHDRLTRAAEGRVVRV